MQLTYKEFTQNENNIKKLIIFLHGYGSNGENLLALAPEISKIIPEAKFFAPNATYNCDMAIPDSYQWFTWTDSKNKIYANLRLSEKVGINGNVVDNTITELPTETEVNNKLAELQTAWDSANGE